MGWHNSKAPAQDLNLAGALAYETPPVAALPLIELLLAVATATDAVTPGTAASALPS